MSIQRFADHSTEHILEVVISPHSADFSLKFVRWFDPSYTVTKSNQLSICAPGPASYRHSVIVFQECPLLVAIEFDL